MAVVYRVVLDKEACMSAGNCVLEAPEGFAFDGDELVELRSGASSLSDERLRSVARNCPGQAIELVDERGEAVDPFERGP